MAEQLERSKIAELTTEIVAAYVSYHQIRPTDVPNIINAVGIELAALGKETDAGAPKKTEPAVSVRRSVRPDHLVCLICGKKQKLLKRHLTVEHELTPDEYRQKFGTQGRLSDGGSRLCATAAGAGLEYRAGQAKEDGAASAQGGRPLNRSTALEAEVAPTSIERGTLCLFGAEPSAFPRQRDVGQSGAIRHQIASSGCSSLSRGPAGLGSSPTIARTPAQRALSLRLLGAN